MNLQDSPGLQALHRQVQAELALLAYAQRDWVLPVRDVQGQTAYDVAVLGGGQAGLGTALALKRDGITNVLVIDAKPAGEEGVWEDFARMTHLRTPKATVGIEGGIPSLSAPAFYQARYGAADWAAIQRVERPRWMEFLRWFRFAAGIDVRNGTECLGLEPDLDSGLVNVHTRSAGVTSTVKARHVVLATGFDGCGAWRVPPPIAHAVHPGRIDHTSNAIDFAALAGKRVGILGHGAAAFDNACVALDHGATSVDLCFRRESIPTVNPHRRLEFAGFLKHFPDLDDATRWRTSRFFEVHDQPPTQNAWDRSTAHGNFRVHAGSPWTEVYDDGRAVHVTTPRGRHVFDHVLCATGAVVDYQARRELRALAPLIRRWADVYTPPPQDRSDTLGDYPYLGGGFEFQPLDEVKGAWVRRVKAFNFASVVSMGPHTTSSSGHKHSIPRLVAGITRSLMVEQAHHLLPALYAYDEIELRPIRKDSV